MSGGKIAHRWGSREIAKLSRTFAVWSLGLMKRGRMEDFCLSLLNGRFYLLKVDLKDLDSISLLGNLPLNQIEPQQTL